MIDEKEEEEGSEIYDIFGDHSESENSNKSSEGNKTEKSSDENKEEKQTPNQNENETTNPPIISLMNAGTNANQGILNKINNISPYLKQSSGVQDINKRGSSIKSADNLAMIFNNTNTNNHLLNNLKNPSNLNVNDIRKTSKGNANNPLFMMNQESMIDADENKEKQGEMNDHAEKLKTQMNKKFIKKVDKIIDFLEKNKIDIESSMGDGHGNPLSLLKKLKNIQDLGERNEIIDKIEGIVTDLFSKSENKKEK